VFTAHEADALAAVEAAAAAVGGSEVGSRRALTRAARNLASDGSDIPKR
jgi:hypothetical protein